MTRKRVRPDRHSCYEYLTIIASRKVFPNRTIDTEECGRCGKRFEYTRG